MILKSRFLVGLAVRLGVLLLSAFAFVQSLSIEGLGAARAVAAIAVIAAAAWLWRHVQQTNRDLVRFIEAVRFADFSQGFGHRFDGSGFAELGEVLNGAVRRMRDERHKLIDSNRFYEAVLDDAPTALLTVDGEGRVELANKASRRLLMRHEGVRIEDFRTYGDSFAKALEGGAVNRPRLVPLILDNVPQTMLVSAAIVHRLGARVRVVAVQPIQGELNAIEIAAQSDLIRVLTHEIMNSMTPVTSLAHSAVKLIREADQGNPAIADARAAIETLSRRADGVMHFVESYRQISRAPEVRRRAIDVIAWAEELSALFRAGDCSEGIELLVRIADGAATIEADPDLMSQVLINLLRNAGEAARQAEKPRVWLRFDRVRSGKVQIEVEDNGSGVPSSIRQDVFLPFFTTKSKGTGVGLSLARQVILAHRGSISILDGAEGGALFRILI